MHFVYVSHLLVSSFGCSGSRQSAKSTQQTDSHNCVTQFKYSKKGKWSHPTGQKNLSESGILYSILTTQERLLSSSSHFFTLSYLPSSGTTLPLTGLSRMLSCEHQLSAQTCPALQTPCAMETSGVSSRHNNNLQRRSQTMC